MDFDEYDYLERTVEIVDASKSVNGRVDGHSSKKRNEEHHGYEHDERSKRSKTAYDKERLNRRERERVRRDIEDTDRLRHKEYGRERERERSHSKSHKAASHRDREREREREREIEKQKDKEKELRDRDHDREYRSSRERRDHKDEPPPSEPEADPERDQRTVFAYQICLKADERDVYEFFSKAGKVRDVRLIMDRNSRRSKGVGYIEFYDVMSVPMAIAMSGQLLRGLPVMVKPSEAEKNLVQSTASTGATGYITPYSGGARRLYVGNLHFNITEDQLRQVFEPFGPVELVQLPTDPETGQCKGFGFVQYTRLEDARTAQQSLNGVLQLAGRVIKVSSVTDQPGMQEFWLTPGELDDDDGGGLSLTAQSRALLMQKLDRSGTVSSAISSMTTPTATPALGLLAPIENGISPLLPGTAFGQVGRPGVAGTPNSGLLATTSLGPASGTVGAEPVGAPTDCLLLRNMFDPKTETEPDFDLDIKDEVQSECSKFGLVKHIFVDKNSAGHVYIRFGSLKAAADAQRALHGRWFAGKMVTTTFLTPRAYEAKFPESR